MQGCSCGEESRASQASQGCTKHESALANRNFLIRPHYDHNMTLNILLFRHETGTGNKPAISTQTLKQSTAGVSTALGCLVFPWLATSILGTAFSSAR